MDPLPDTHRRLAAILLTDMVGFSSLTQKNETLALELLNQHFTFLRPFFAEFRGHEIKTMGDSFLVEFPSASDAVHCAVKVQQAILSRNSKVPPESRFEIRIGIHVGDIFFQSGDIFGDGVNITARIEPLAPVNGICLSQAVMDQIQIKVPYPIVPLRPTQLKNITKTIPLYVMDVKGYRAKAPRKKRLLALVAVSLCSLAGFSFYLTQMKVAPLVPALPVTAWFDAGDLAAQPGARVATWTAKGGPSVRAVQPDPDSQPTIRLVNGIPAIEFDGARHFLTLDSLKNEIKRATAVTFFYVLQTQSRRTQYVLTCHQPDLADVFRGGFREGRIHFVSTKHTATTVDRLNTPSGWSAYRFSVRARSVAMAQNGNPLGNYAIPSVAFAATEFCSIGQDWDRPAGEPTGPGQKVPSDLLKGRLAELLIYTRALTEEEIQATERYLHRKYPVSLNKD